MRNRTWVGGLVAGMLMAGCARYDGPAEVARARSSGSPATAKILSGEDTRSRFGKLELVRFRLEIQATDVSPARTIEADTLLDPYAMSQYPPGAKKSIRTLADNPTFFAFME